MPTPSTQPDCAMPLSPDLRAKVLASRHALQPGDLTSERTDDLLDTVTLNKILTRPPKTRPDTFVAPKANLAPITGQRQVLVLLVDFSDAAAAEPRDHFNDLLFSTGSTPQATCGTSTAKRPTASWTWSAPSWAPAGIPPGGSGRPTRRPTTRRELRVQRPSHQRAGAGRAHPGSRGPARELLHVRARWRCRGARDHLRRNSPRRATGVHEVLSLAPRVRWAKVAVTRIVNGLLQTLARR